MNLELQKQAILKELGYSDLKIKEILEYCADPANLDEYGAYPFLNEEWDYIDER